MAKARKRKHRTQRVALHQEIIRERGAAGRQKMSPGKPHFIDVFIHESIYIYSDIPV